MAKLNKSTSTSAKLKASGAKYSTTNSSGKQSFYSSSNEGSKAIGTSSRSSSSVIPMDAMQNTPVANIPPKPQVNDVGTTPLSIDPALSQMGYTVQDNQYVYDPKKTEGENAVAQASNQNMSTLQSVLSFIGKPEDKSQEFARLEKKAGISDLQRQVGDYTSSLNNIVAKQQQDLLQLRGTGSEQGVTEAVYGGQQATINREAAIRALPVQAALSAAQGNLEMAQQRVNQLFSIKSADMDAQYKYKQDVGNAVLQIANEEQKNILNLKLSEIKDKNDLAKDNLNYLRDLTNTAIQNGRTGAIAQIAAIDPKSPTFNQDVARIAGSVVKPVSPGDGAPKVVSINGVDSIWNPSTQQFEAATVGGATGLKPIKDAEIKDLSETWTAKNSITSIIDQMTQSIENEGTKIFWGGEAGKRGSNKTNLLLAMKNLEKTGALDKGTIDVLADLIPENEFWATEARQIASLNQLKDTINSKVQEYAGSYRGTSAEVDPRTKRIYGNVELDTSSFQPEEVNEVYSLYGVSQSTPTGAFNPDDWLK